MMLRAAVVTALAGAALAVPAAPATAAACSQDSGVTVIVDFASLGGGQPTRCAPGDPSNGIAALRGAGFTPTRAAQEPGYFVCRINGKPANDPCQRTSPADAYWSYWHARPGGSWTYGNIGGSDYDPAPGTVDGWAFGAGKPPSTPPPRASTPSAGRSPSTVGPAASPSPTRKVPTVAGTGQATARTSAAPAPSPTAAAASPDSTAAAATARPAATAAPPRSDIVTRSKPLRPNGIPLGAIAAVVLVLLLVSAAVAQVARRRREDGT